jgi:nitrogenase-stabilizing/protective protein
MPGRIREWCMIRLKSDLSELSSAEDFLNYFKIPYEERVVRINRLHIMKKMRDYLEEYGSPDTFNDFFQYALYREILMRAYEDFRDSTALDQRVFKVHKQYNPERLKNRRVS